MTKILFIGFGLSPTRKEAVSINFYNHVKYILPKNLKYYVYSIPINQPYLKYLISFPRYFKEVNELISNSRIDIIHDMFVMPGLSLLFRLFAVSSMKNISFVKELHNNHGYTRKLRFESLLRIVFSSKYIIKMIINKFDITYSRSKYISENWRINYIPQYIPSYKKERISFDKEIINFCYLGHALGKKGIDAFPKIIRNIEKDNSGKIIFNFAFSDLGNKNEITRLIKRAAKNKNIKVNFYDKITAKDFFRKNHFFILPLRDEYSATSVPNTILEAMEAGCVPIVSKNNIVKSIIRDNKNGIFIKNDLSRQINILINDFYVNHEKYDKISKESRKYVKLNHDLKKIKKEFEIIYGY